MSKSAMAGLERLVAFILLGLAGCGTGASEASSGESVGRRSEALELTQEAKLSASSGDEDHFGSSVSISGDTALVGAWDTTEPGAAYVFVRSGETWSQQAKLAPSDGAPRDLFGYSVGISGEAAVVSAVGKGNEQVAAYVFARSGGVWSQQARLTVNGIESFTHDWPAAVAMSGDTVIAGKEWSAGPAAREAYVFTRSEGTWTQQATLTSGEPGDSFGNSLSISGDTVLVAAPGAQGGHGAVHAYARSGGTWSEQAVFGTSDESWKFTGFGRAVAVSGDTAVVGAPAANSKKGAAYVFVRNGVDWWQEMKLVPSVAEVGDSFGQSVAVSGDLIIVGSRKAAPGAAWVFSRSGTYWTQRQVLTANDVGAGACFGNSVGVSGNTAVVGASLEPTDADGGGAAYVFATKAPELGAACLSASHCESGYCVDGVCCNTPCGAGNKDDCLACSKAAGASDDGMCAPLDEGATCDDKSKCTKTDTCQAGKCVGNDLVTCGEYGPCSVTTCDPAVGTCTHETHQKDGQPCPGGYCEYGLCIAAADAGHEAGAAGHAGASDDAGNEREAGFSPADGASAGDGASISGGGCGCRTAGERRCGMAGLIGLWVVAAAIRRRESKVRSGHYGGRNEVQQPVRQN